jgi:outer membrane biosynthesis protein TonB
MQDPFLADALDGYDTVKSDHVSRIEELQKEMNRKAPSKGQLLYYWVIAAIILVLIAAGIYFFEKEPIEEISPLSEIAIETENQADSSVISVQEEIVPVAILPVVEPRIIQPETTPAISVAEKPEESQTVLELQKELPATVEIVEIQAETPVPTLQPEMIQTSEDLSSVTPQPVGGTKAFENYLKHSLIRPQDEDCKGKKGRVSLRFYIDHSGRPSNIEVIRSLCPSADQEAIRLVNAGPSWSRGGRAVWAHINF